MQPVDGFLYLASPYSHHDPWVRVERFDQTVRAAAKLMRAGHIVFSPIVHTHHLQRFVPGHTHDFWIAQDTPILQHAAKVLVLQLDGWQHSKGIAEEVKIAQSFGIPIEHANPDEL